MVINVVEESEIKFLLNMLYTGPVKNETTNIYLNAVYTFFNKNLLAKIEFCQR